MADLLVSLFFGYFETAQSDAGVWVPIHFRDTGGLRRDGHECGLLDRLKDPR